MTTTQTASSRSKRQPPKAPAKRRSPSYDKEARKRGKQTKPQKLWDGGTIQVASAKPQAPTELPVLFQERDGRAMSRMDPDTKDGHSLLERWARETYEGAPGALPSTTLLGRVMEQGPAAGSPGRPVSTLSDESAQVDVFVATLWGRVQRFVMGYYLKRQKCDVIAKIEKVSANIVREGLRRARALLQLWMMRGKSEGSKRKAQSTAARVRKLKELTELAVPA